MSEMKIYSPEGLSNADAGITTLTPNPTLAGKRIAALDNGKAGANHLLTAMATRLAERSGATFVGLHRKGSAATPCEARPTRKARPRRRNRPDGHRGLRELHVVESPRHAGPRVSRDPHDCRYDD